MQINIQPSYDTFRALRESNAYYVDKTRMLREYLDGRFDRAALLARPRRFGKTLTMTMIRDFLDIRQDSRQIFEGLDIMSDPDTVHRYMNQYPVVFISLKEVFGSDFGEILQNLRIAVSKLCEEYAYLLESPKISDASRSVFDRLWHREGNQGDTEQSLDLICLMLRQYYGKPAFVLVDEIDAPMAKAVGTPAYEKTRDMAEHMLSYVCRTNENVRAVLLSGCLYTVKGSTYTGVNNIVPYTVLSPVYASYLGFTDAEVRQILADAGISDHYELAVEWYDGYLFGREKMYCPWDVLLFVRSVLDGSYSSAMGPKSYWVNTSEIPRRMIRQMIRGQSAGVPGKTPDAGECVEQLLAGHTIDCLVNESIPYHRIYERGDNIWSALLETGYLTKAVPEEMPLMPLKIPNREIQTVFREEVWSWFRDKIDNTFVRDFVNALWAEETQNAEHALNQILEETLSFYHEYHEYSYHLILGGLFAGVGYRVLPETETGYGRSDLIVPDSARSRALILELKHVRKEEEMETALAEADSQIIRKYERRLICEGYRTRVRYGLSFWEKRARVAKA